MCRLYWQTPKEVIKPGMCIYKEPFSVDMVSPRANPFSSADQNVFIIKTYLHNFNHLKTPLLYSKLGFTGVYIIFLTSAQKHIFWVLVWTASSRRGRGGSNKYPLSMFWAEICKISDFFFYLKTVFGGEIFNIFNRRVFVMLQTVQILMRRLVISGSTPFAFFVSIF